jgi:uncharacterized protein (TIGR03083 family)
VLRPEAHASPYDAGVNTAELYPLSRAGLLELADVLSREQAREPVPALPGWTVKDTYAHLTGLCADIIDGRMEGAGSPPWTAKQVHDRADRSLPEVCAEWVERGPAFDAWLNQTGEEGTVFVSFDVWTHHQDIRAAIGLTGERDRELLAYLVDNALTAFDRRFREAGAPPLHVVADRVDRTLGDGSPAATLRTDDYELLRILFGRRSLTQMAHAHWDGDPTPHLDHIHLFEPPAADLVD